MGVRIVAVDAPVARRDGAFEQQPLDVKRAAGTPYGELDTPTFVVVNRTYRPTMACALADALLVPAHQAILREVVDG